MNMDKLGHFLLSPSFNPHTQTSQTGHPWKASLPCYTSSLFYGWVPFLALSLGCCSASSQNNDSGCSEHPVKTDTDVLHMTLRNVMLPEVMRDCPLWLWIGFLNLLKTTIHVKWSVQRGLHVPTCMELRNSANQQVGFFSLFFWFCWND